MIVTCTHCNTTYNLPDEKAVAGTKLRCSVCKNVFRLPEPPKEEEIIPQRNASDEESSPISIEGFGADKSPKPDDKLKKPKSSKGKIVTLLVLLLVIGGGSFALWQFTSLLNPVKNMVANTFFGEEVDETLAVADVERVRLIELRNVRQYNVSNEKIGKISVIEGSIVNGFDSPRELIRIEANLYDAEGRVLVTKSVLAGTSASLFQLQVLGEQELEQALSNSIDILANNSNVQPGGVVPFMVLFYNPPADAVEFGVKVVDARTVISEVEPIEE